MRPASALALLATALAASSATLGLCVSRSGEWRFAAGLAIVVVWRLAFGRDGRGLLPQRAVAVLFMLLLAAGVPYLLDLARVGSGTVFFEGVLGTLTCFLGATLLAPLGPFGAFWTTLMASTQLALAASLADDVLAAALLVLCVALVAWTLLLLERAVPPSGEAGVRRLTDPASRRPAALRGAAWRLALLGLAGGTLLWLVTPRPGPGGGVDEARPVWDTTAELASSRHGAAPASEGITGPDENSGDDAVLGVVDRIQQDGRVHVEARLLEGSEEPAVILREAVRDLWQDAPGSSAPRWRSSRSLEHARLLPDASGLITLGEPHLDRPERTLGITYRLGSAIVFLEPEPLWFRALRPRAADSGRDVIEGATLRLGSGRLERRLLPGDIVVMRGQPQQRGGSGLSDRESSARVAPLTSYAGIDERVASRLRALVEDVPGVSGADAWRRARALEAWLQGPEFTYALSSPALAAGRRVEDFLTRVRRGNCEWYATALTLLLRAHGHAARYVQGYWGGSHTPGSGVWTFHGASYHAWTELYLDGVGWVPLNPTPPERLAALAGATAEAGRRGRFASEGERGAPLSERLRGWGGAAWTWIREGMEGRRGQLGRWAVVLLGALVVLAFACALRGRRRVGAGSAQEVADAQALAQALRLLARRGFPRPPAWTAREFVLRSGRGLKAEALAALERIVARHELRRYAGREQPDAADRDDLKALAGALKPGRARA